MNLLFSNCRNCVAFMVTDFKVGDRKIIPWYDILTEKYWPKAERLLELVSPSNATYAIILLMLYLSRFLRTTTYFYESQTSKVIKTNWYWSEKASANRRQLFLRNSDFWTEFSISRCYNIYLLAIVLGILYEYIR